MATVMESLYTELQADAPLTALVSDRIYPDEMPQGKALPNVVFRQIGLDPVHAMSADSALESVGVQIDCYGGSRLESTGVDEAVQDALRDFNGVMGSGVTVQRAFIRNTNDLSFLETTGTFRRQSDYEIWYIRQ